MPDIYDPAKRSDVMRAVRSQGTRPEVLVEELVATLGFIFERHLADLPGRPDIVVPALRRAIFVNGCFWHQHHGCKHSALPATNREAWEAKLRRNTERDQENLAALLAMGWTCLTVWECETRRATMPQLRDRIQTFLG